MVFERLPSGSATGSKDTPTGWSGGSTVILFVMQSSNRILTLSVSSIASDIFAAMNSAGWCAFSHAV